MGAPLSAKQHAPGAFMAVYMYYSVANLLQHAVVDNIVNQQQVGSSELSY